MCQQVVEHQAHAGIALDGDADRVIVVDEKGQIVDGDAVMAICARDLIRKDRLPNRTVVSTVMSNLGLQTSLADVGGKLIRTQVGDRYVVETMRRHGYTFGGEQSGHLVFLEHTSTGDGCIAGLMLLEVMVRSGKPLSELATVFERVPQKLVNIKVSKKPPLDSLERCQAVIREVERKLGGKGRVLVRYSGTENKARVMVEGPNLDQTTAFANDIAEAIQSEIGLDTSSAG